jgi:hypothetical protein
MLDNVHIQRTKYREKTYIQHKININKKQHNVISFNNNKKEIFASDEMVDSPN